MGYLHCCGGLHKTKSFKLAPQDEFVLCEIDVLEQCPVCGHYVVQLTRLSKENKISTIRLTNLKARKFLKKIQPCILYEEREYDYSKMAYSTFYLNYNEYGVKKRCYSNLSSLRLGKF